VTAHVAPDRWADRLAGRVAAAEAERMDAHAAGCAGCAAARARVESARASLALVRGSSVRLPAAELAPRVYWSASMRMRRPPRRRWLLPVATLAVAAAGAAVTVVLLRARPAPVVLPRPAPAPAPAVIAAPAPAPLATLVTFLQGEVRHNGVAATADVALAPSDVVATAAGRLAVQLGPRSGVLLEPDSRLVVLRLDAAAIELSIEGAAAFELAPRGDGQRFAVHAAGRVIEVRGTRFQVAARDRALDVAVHRGRVTVGDRDVAAGSRLAGEAVAPLEDGARAAHVPLLPVWDPEGSTVLAIEAPHEQAVRVDGIEVARGSFQLRTVAGRHLVEAGRDVRWIEVEGARAEISLLPTPRSERPAQLEAQLRAHRAAVARCAEAERKVDPAFTGAVEVEIGVEADGSLGSVAGVGRSTHPRAERCVVDVLRARLTFPRGTEATLRKQIRF
jgi:hypothetical protein